MNVDGNVLMWAFGLVFVAVAGLTALVWKMQTHRIAACEDRATDDRQQQRVQAEGIYGAVADTQMSIGELKVLVAQNTVTRDECDRIRASCARRT